MTKKRGVLLLLVLFPGVLFSPSCKTVEECYSILGTWMLVVNIPPQAPLTTNISFTGYETDGGVNLDGVRGTFSKQKMQVTFGTTDGVTLMKFTGSFSDENAMNGSVTAQNVTTLASLSGTWMATR